MVSPIANVPLKPVDLIENACIVVEGRLHTASEPVVNDPKLPAVELDTV